MISVNTHEAKTTLSRLLSEVESRQVTVKICRNGKPIAMLTPIRDIVDPLKMHSKLMDIKFHEDIESLSDQNEWPDRTNEYSGTE